MHNEKNHLRNATLNNKQITWANSITMPTIKQLNVYDNHACEQSQLNWPIVILPFGIANMGVYGKSSQIVALATMLAGKGYSNIISASADGGPLSWVCAHKTLCSAPHQH